MKPKILRKPKIGLMLILALDIVFPLGAVAVNILRDSLPYSYSFIDGAIITRDPLAWYGVVAAVGMGALAVLTGLVIAAIVTSAGKEKVAGKVTLTALLLVFSFGVLGVSSLFALKIPPSQTILHSYKDENGVQLIISDEQNLSSCTARFFLINDETATLLAATEISEIFADDDRYTIAWVSDSVLTISFEDGAHYRSLQINVPQ